jgi:hypothetical protein
MEIHSFRCTSCKTLLRVRANKAGQKVRCKSCGAVSTIPTRVLPEPEPDDEATADEGSAEAERHEGCAGDKSETVGVPESVPTARRKRVRKRASPDRAAYLRSAPGWRKVRLGLILIALAMALQCLGILVFCFVPLVWAPLTYLLQALPLAGNLLCAFVPLKGVTRNLVIANLGVIALGLALTLVAGRMSQPAADQSLARSQEWMKKATESDEEQELRKKLADLRKKAAAGDKDAAKEEQELSRKLTDLQNNRLEEMRKESERALAELKDVSSKSVSGLLGFWSWVYLQGTLIYGTIQIIMLSFFIRAVALTLDDKDLAGSCPRVAGLALLTLTLVLLLGILPLRVSFVSRLLGWILYVLGMVSYVWQGAQLVEAATLVGNHLNPKSI